MANSYKHTQGGTMTTLGLGFGLIICALVYISSSLKGNPLPPVAVIILGSVFIVLAILLVLFSSLTTSLDGRILHVFFGPGLVGKKISLDEIQSCEIVTYSWFWGWGIRWTPNGPLWNVSGLQAVKLTFKNGKRFQIGTDDPEGLLKAISQR